MNAKKITVKLSDKEKRNWVINSDEKFQRYLKAANAVALVDGPDYVSVFEELKSEVEYTLWRGEQGSSTSAAGTAAVAPGSGAEILAVWRQIKNEALEGLKELFITEDKQEVKAKLVSVAISKASRQHVEVLEDKLKFEVLNYKKFVKPSTVVKVDAFAWSNQREDEQADRYIPHLKKWLEPYCVAVAEKVMLDVYNANDDKTRLSTDALVELTGMRFRGTTDVLVAWEGTNPVCEESSVLAMELKKPDLVASKQAHYQAIVSLVLLNLKSNGYRPFLLLTDLNDYFTFYWIGPPMQGRKLPIYWYHCLKKQGRETRSDAVGIVYDLLNEAVDKLQPAEDLQQSIDLSVLLPRDRLPMEWFSISATDDVADLADVVPANKVAEYRAVFALRDCTNLEFYPEPPSSPPSWYG